jgi:transglutaminase-like putative cysteine protease
MIYDIRQTTTYHYASHVAYARHVLRLTPIDRPGQRVHATALDVEPAPIERREGGDFFGNRMTWIELDQPHDMLSVRVAARVAVKRDAAPPVEATPPWEHIRAAAFASVDLSPNSPTHYLFASRQVSLDPEIRAYAAESFLPERPVLDAAVDLMRRIKADFVYEIGATTASTTPPMSFALRRGVCQDFAHIMISGMRGLGLPAAYVSGYLRTGPLPTPPPHSASETRVKALMPGEGKDGGERLEGADAMHAWVLVWCGEEAGWIGLDPTNAIPAVNDHVVLAIGRDYADVAPIDGVIFASGGQRLAVAVSVTPVAP